MHSEKDSFLFLARSVVLLPLSGSHSTKAREQRQRSLTLGCQMIQLTMIAATTRTNSSAAMRMERGFISRSLGQSGEGS